MKKEGLILLMIRMNIGQPSTEWKGSPGHIISHGRQEESGCTINGIYVWFIWYYFFLFLNFFFSHTVT